MTDQPTQPATPTNPDARAGRRVFLETFGCQMNVLDSQLVTSQLRGLGYTFVDDWKQADVVLYNTCSVREHAEQKAWSRVGEVGKYKERRPDLVLGVIGCMAEREGMDMVRKFPQVDLLCGPGELDKVPMLIDNAVRTSYAQRQSNAHAEVALQGNTHRRSGTLTAAADQLELLDLSRSFSPDEVQGAAYVRITRGCNKFCTYCVVPNTRGAEVHRPPKNIIDECRRLVDAGAIEITLLGQTVNHYHFDHAAAVVVDGLEQPQIGAPVNVRTSGHAGKARRQSSAGIRKVTSFADLLRRIHDEVPDLQRLRFITNFPRDFGNDILETMRDCPRICRYLHLPVQSGSDRILKLMNRDYTVAEYRDLLHRVRTILPDCTIASDLICGFPTETDEDHAATCDLLREGRFKNCFIFKYSPRPGTVAIDKHADDVPEEVKRRRNNELLAIQSEMSHAVHGDYVGRKVRVFVEGLSHKEQKSRNTADPAVVVGWDRPRDITQLTGRTDGDLIVMFDGDESLIGQMVEVRVEKAAALALFGSVTNDAVVV